MFRAISMPSWHARRDSPNMGWRNASFRGFADYMQTSEFEAGLHRLLKLARQKRSAIMCAEAVPWRCHRSLIADALTVRGVRVEHILSGKHLQFHSINSFARVRGSRITYPDGTQLCCDDGKIHRRSSTRAGEDRVFQGGIGKYGKMTGLYSQSLSYV
jgi:hypothetical protein